MGSAFADPLLIATLHGTFSPVSHLFFEVGVDAGLVSVYEYTDFYFSVYPFAHACFFLPFGEKGGWFAGAGGGFMIAEYDFYDSNNNYYSASVRQFGIDATTGVNIGNWFIISYTLRTNFKSASNKISAGFVYRFK